MGFPIRKKSCSIEGMSSIFKLKTSSLLALGSCAGIIGIVAGCGGGGGGGGSSTPSVPSPFDGTYTATYLPASTIPSDGTAPTGTLAVTNGRASGTFTFYLQPTVVKNVQTEIDKQLTSYGIAGDIRNNQVPSTIPFNLVKGIDSTGKAVFTATSKVKVCGTGTLTVDSTFLATGGGSGTYTLTFPNAFTISARGSDRQVALKDNIACNNLPLRTGTVTFSRPTPTATPVVTTAPAA
jgi:hypothetical protein